jgi:hypothetical protein
VDACTNIGHRERRLAEQFEFTLSSQWHQLVERLAKVGDVREKSV